MPLERGSPIGYDARLMVFRFSMVSGSEVISCEVSGSAMDRLERIRRYGAPHRLEQFLRLRDRIEVVASYLWDAGDVSPDNKVRIFGKHFRDR
jgi:hypothetical protein